MRLRGAAALCLTALAPVAWAQQQLDTGQRSTGLIIQPRLGVQVTATDNVMLTHNGDDALITSVTPGISLVSRGGRFVGMLDYSLSSILYTKTEQGNRFQQALRASGSVDVIENTFQVDAVANISQQSISALGAQTSDSSLGGLNRTEVATLTVSPLLHGRIGPLALFELRGTLGESRTKNNTLGNVQQTGGSLNLTGPNPGIVNWFATLSDQRSQFRGYDNDSRSTQAYAGLRFVPDVDVMFSLNGGRERSNYLSGTEETSALWGGSVTWAPSPRTKVAADWMRHNYGNSHSFNIEHRLARSAFRYTDTQAVSQLPQVGQVSLGSVYDLLFQQYASIEPDPVKRDALVRAFLSSNGINPDSQLVSRVLTNAPSIQRSQQLSYTFTGVRMSFVLSASGGWTNRLGTTTVVSGDLSNFQRIVQRGVSGTVTHKVSPLSTLGLSYGVIHNSGEGGTTTIANNIQLRTATLSLQTQLALRTQLSVLLRHAQSDGATSYRENALTANLVQTF
ncbi:TIGR03016 family PEP-CTERM system-associated outer membrane protein [Burkholderiaceae bacterium UC74_6]